MENPTDSTKPLRLAQLPALVRLAVGLCLFNTWGPPWRRHPWSRLQDPAALQSGKFEMQPPGATEFKPYLDWMMRKK